MSRKMLELDILTGLQEKNFQKVYTAFLRIDNIRSKILFEMFKNTKNFIFNNILLFELFFKKVYVATLKVKDIYKGIKIFNFLQKHFFYNTVSSLYKKQTLDYIKKISDYELGLLEDEEDDDEYEYEDDDDEDYEDEEDEDDEDDDDDDEDYEDDEKTYERVAKKKTKTKPKKKTKPKNKTKPKPKQKPTKKKVEKVKKVEKEEEDDVLNLVSSDDEQSEKTEKQKEKKTDDKVLDCEVPETEGEMKRARKEEEEEKRRKNNTTQLSQSEVSNIFLVDMTTSDSSSSSSGVAGKRKNPSSPSSSSSSSSSSYVDFTNDDEMDSDALHASLVASNMTHVDNHLLGETWLSDFIISEIILSQAHEETSTHFFDGYYYCDEIVNRGTDKYLKKKKDKEKRGGVENDKLQKHDLRAINNKTNFCFVAMPIQGLNHWVSCFCDLQGKTLYIFDPYGKPKYIEAKKEMKRNILQYLKDKTHLEDFTVIENTLSYKPQNQMDFVNCGVYSMMFLEYMIQSINDGTDPQDRVSLFANSKPDTVKWRKEQAVVLKKKFQSIDFVKKFGQVNKRKKNVSKTIKKTKKERNTSGKKIYKGRKTKGRKTKGRKTK